MNDIIIKVDTETGRAVSNTELLGIKGQNLQNKLIFKMSEKIKGIAWCEVRQDNTLSYIALKENNTGYEANILSSLLTTSSVDVNLRITETENSSGVPVFVSSIVSFVVLDSINASEQMPEEYPSWLDIANAKMQEIENVNIESERIDTGVLIKTTDNQGKTTTVELKDGKDGEKGDKGDQGEPGAVKMQIVDVLPTTGRSDTIYLVKKEHPTERNLYEEYIYTNGDWEHIGDTSVDLTDYYNKNQVDEKLDGKQNILTAGDNINLENNTISAEINTFTIDYYSLKTEDAETLIKVIDLVKAGKNFQLYAFLGSEKLLCTDVRNYTDSSPYFYFANPRPFYDTTRYGINYTTYFYYVVTLDIKNKKATQTNDYNLVLNHNQAYKLPLGVNNTSAYTPTGDYNPATKKYVDDSIKSAITDTLGGSY